MVEPRAVALDILGLGTSVGTPAGGIQAQAIVVKSFDELEQKADEVGQGAAISIHLGLLFAQVTFIWLLSLPRLALLHTGRGEDCGFQPTLGGILHLLRLS